MLKTVSQDSYINGHFKYIPNYGIFLSLFKSAVHERGLEYMCKKREVVLGRREGGLEIISALSDTHLTKLHFAHRKYHRL